MVAHFLRLKFALLANSFRRHPWQVLGLIVGLFYGLGTAAIIVASLVELRWVEVDIARDAVIVLSAVTMFLFTTLPLALGLDDPLDPRKFGLFGIRTTKLAAVLIVGSVVSVPAFVITAISLAQLVTWGRDGLSELLAIAAAVLIVLTCLLSARISTSLAAFLLSTRRARDFTAIGAIVAAIAFSPLIIVASTIDWKHYGLQLLSDVADVVSWTPIAAAWAIPGDAANGDLDMAFEKLAIAIGTVVVLAVVWRVLVGRMLTTPVLQPHSRTYSGLGLFDVFARTPTGAIAARSLTYWLRDTRYGTSLVIIPIIPVFMVISLYIAGIPLNVLALVPLPIICLFLSWFVHNDVSFDNTALWLHLSTSTSGRADRLGRLIPVLVVGIPLIAIGATVSAWLYGDWFVLGSLVGVSTSILLTGLGLSSITSARFPYPTVRPGDSPFSQPQGGGSPAGMIQAFSFLTILILAVPAVFAAVLGFTVDNGWHLLSLAIGVGVGVIALVIGVAVGSRVYDRRTSELLVSATQN